MIIFLRKYSFVFVFLTIIFLMGIYILSSNSHQEADQYTITIKDGDSLWSISKHFAEENGLPTAKLVKIIEEKNQLYGKVLKSGEQIVIPGEFIQSPSVKTNLALKE